MVKNKPIIDEPMSPAVRLKEIDEMILTLERNDAKADFIYAERRGIIDSLSWVCYRLEEMRMDFCVSGGYLMNCCCPLCDGVKELLRDLEEMK